MQCCKFSSSCPAFSCPTVWKVAFIPTLVYKSTRIIIVKPLCYSYFTQQIEKRKKEILQVTKKAAMTSVSHLAKPTGLRLTATATCGKTFKLVGLKQRSTARSKADILPQSPQKKQTTTFLPYSIQNMKITNPCGSEAMTKKRRVSGNGQTALPGALKLGWKRQQGTGQKHKTVLSSSEMERSGEMMIAPWGTISCAAKSFVHQVGFNFQI